MIKDNEKVYDEQIAPLMDKIIKICQENELPMFVTFAYKYDNGNLMCTTSLPFGVRKLKQVASYIYQEGSEV